MNYFIQSKTKKTIYSILKNVPGIGNKKIKEICKKIGFLPSIRWELLTENQKTNFFLWFEENITKKIKIGLELKQFSINQINCIKARNCYRGVRKKKKLPSRGQRTHTNAKTTKKKL